MEVRWGTMGRALTSVGIVALVAAFGWWQAFYGEVHRLLGMSGPLPLESLIDSFMVQLNQVFMLRVFHVGTIY